MSAESPRPIVTLLDRWAWIKAVGRDRTLPSSALHVAVVIADHVNAKTHEAWPSQATIADRTGLQRRAISGIINGPRTAAEGKPIRNSLASAGHLSVVVQHGRGGSNRYRLRHVERKASDADGAAGNVHADARHEEDGHGTNVHADARLNVHGDDQETRTRVPTISMSHQASGSGAASPLGGAWSARGLADDMRLDPDDATVLHVVEAVMRDALAAKPPRDARNRGDALKRIRRRLAADQDFAPYRALVDTTAYRVGDLRRGVVEAVERAKVELTTWSDLVRWVEHAARDRLVRTPRPPAAARCGAPDAP